MNINTTEDEKKAEIRRKMLDITNMKIQPVPAQSPWLRPARITFRQNEQDVTWDLSRVYDSVTIITFNITRKKLIFVRQFRPAVYYGGLPEKFQNVDTKEYPLEAGLALELCAGIIDKDLPPIEIAQAELREECGYEAPLSAFTEIISYRNVGSTTGKHTLFYVEVTDEMLTHPGGGAEEEGELIEVIEMDVSEAEKYISSKSVASPPSLLFGVLWFLTNKKDRYS